MSTRAPPTSRSTILYSIFLVTRTGARTPSNRSVCPKPPSRGFFAAGAMHEMTTADTALPNKVAVAATERASRSEPRGGRRSSLERPLNKPVRGGFRQMGKGSAGGGCRRASGGGCSGVVGSGLAPGLQRHHGFLQEAAATPRHRGGTSIAGRMGPPRRSSSVHHHGSEGPVGRMGRLQLPRFARFRSTRRCSGRLGFGRLRLPIPPAAERRYVRPSSTL